MIYIGYIAALAAGILISFLLFRRQGRSVTSEPLPKESSPVDSPSEETIRVHEKEDFQVSLRSARHELNNLHIVNELSQKITASLSLNDSFQHIYHTINSMMDAAVMELDVRYGNEKEHLRYSNLTTDGSINYHNHIAQWVFDNKRQVYLPDAEHDYGRYVNVALTLPDGRTARSLLAFPVTDQQDVIGVLTVISFKQNAFENFHLEMIRHLIPFITVAIKNAFNHHELNMLKQRAERSEAFMQQFLANMSHEIRTPIHAVTGMSQLLLERSPAEEQVRYLKSIYDASETLMGIINDILDLSKIEANKLEIEQIDLSVSHIVDHVRDLMQLRADEKEIKLITIVDPSIAPVLTGDPVRLTQILINLAGNAIKFTEKGSVKVSVDLNPNSTIPSENVNDLFFSVSDTGIGMTDEQQKKLFQKYSQVSSEISRKYGGTGLGLSIARSLVALLGGELGVNSRIGEGTTFFFKLKMPVSRNKALDTGKETANAGLINDLKGIRVLVVDDNEYNRTVAKESLEIKLKDVHVEEAADGKAAIESVRNNKYDVVLMDIVMPGMDGYEVATIIRHELKMDKTTLPLIALSASAVKNEVDKCYACGMNGFLAKPFKATDLIRVIHQVVHNEGQPNGSGVSSNEQKNSDAGTVINMDHLTEYMEGDKERMKKQLLRFEEKIPAFLKEFRDSLNDDRLEDARIRVHSIKPMLALMGMSEAHHIAESLEQGCRNGNETAELKGKFNELELLCKNALKEIALVNQP